MSSLKDYQIDPDVLIFSDEFKWRSVMFDVITGERLISGVPGVIQYCDKEVTKLPYTSYDEAVKIITTLVDNYRMEHLL